MSSAWADLHKQHLSVCSHTLNNWWLLSSLSESLLDRPLSLSSVSTTLSLLHFYLPNFFSLFICHILSFAVSLDFSSAFSFVLSPTSRGGPIGFNPMWEETLVFTVHMPELALVRFLVWDHDPIGQDFIGQRTIAFNSMMPGKIWWSTCFRSKW